MGLVEDFKKSRHFAKAELVEEMPHEFLLRVMRGDKFTETRLDLQGNITTIDVYPTLQLRMEAAKIAAPYYSPRLQAATLDVKGSLSVVGLADRLTEAENRLRDVS